jgi:hypothetical protein
MGIFRGFLAITRNADPLSSEPPVDPDQLSEQAARCRRLAKGLTDQRTITSLLAIAAECEATLAAERRDGSPPTKSGSQQAAE